MHAGESLAGESALDGPVGSGAHEDRVVGREEFVEADIAPHVDTQPELNAHALEYLAARLHDRLLELERRNAEGEQPTDARVPIVDDRGDAVADQDVRASESGRPGADDRDPLAGRLDLRQVRPPAGLERFIGDVLLDGSDRHGAELVIERAGALAQPVLRADAATHLGQRVRAVRQFRRLEQVSLFQQLQPVRNEVVHGALPLAERVATGKAATGLQCRVLGDIGAVDLAVGTHALLDRELGGVQARDVEEIQGRVGHRQSLRPRGAGCRSACRSRPPSP